MARTRYVMLLAVTACVAGMLAENAGAADTRDPLQPPAQWIAAEKKASAAADGKGAAVHTAVAAHGEERMTGDGIALQSIFNRDGKHYALIGGELVKKGGRYRDAKVVEIGDDSVVLLSPGGRQVIYLDPDVARVRVPLQESAARTDKSRNSQLKKDAQ